jgi:hypothetical protein
MAEVANEQRLFPHQQPHHHGQAHVLPDRRRQGRTHHAPIEAKNK